MIAPFYPSLTGYTSRSVINDTWSDIITGNGNSGGSTAEEYHSLGVIFSDGTSSKWFACTRGILIFDTSYLGSATITSAKLYFYKYSATNTLSTTQYIELTSGTVGSYSSIVAADYQRKGSTVLSDALNVATLPSGYSYYTLNSSGISNINKSGYTVMFARIKSDVDNSAPTWGAYKTAQVASYSYIYSDPSYRPYLLLEYTGDWHGSIEISQTLGISATPIIFSNKYASITISLDLDILSTPIVDPPGAIQTLVIYSSADGYVERNQNNKTWSELRDGVGDDLDQGVIFAGLDCDNETNKYARLQRGILIFDTSQIIGNHIEQEYIQSIKLCLYSNNKGKTLSSTPSICITSGTVNTPTTITASDYQNKGSTEISDTRISYNDWNIDGYNIYTLNATGESYIDYDGETVMFVRLSWDVDNSPPSWQSWNYAWVNVSFSATPYLEITWSGPYYESTTISQDLGITATHIVNRQRSMIISQSLDVVINLTEFECPDNILTNPGFETGDLTGWNILSSFNASYSVTDVEKDTGSYSFYGFAGVAYGLGYVYLRQNNITLTGDSILTLRRKTGSASYIKLEIVLQGYDYGNPNYYIYTTYTPSPTWETIEITDITYTGTYNLLIKLETTNVNGDHECWVDNVALGPTKIEFPAFLEIISCPQGEYLLTYPHEPCKDVSVVASCINADYIRYKWVDTDWEEVEPSSSITITRSFTDPTVDNYITIETINAGSEYSATSDLFSVLFNIELQEKLYLESPLESDEYTDTGTYFHDRTLDNNITTNDLGNVPLGNIGYTDIGRFISVETFQDFGDTCTSILITIINWIHCRVKRVK